MTPQQTTELGTAWAGTIIALVVIAIHGFFFIRNTWKQDQKISDLTVTQANLTTAQAETATSLGAVEDRQERHGQKLEKINDVVLLNTPPPGTAPSAGFPGILPTQPPEDINKSQRLETEELFAELRARIQPETPSGSPMINPPALPPASQAAVPVPGGATDTPPPVPLPTPQGGINLGT